ncbi:beta-ketoacyl synthase N-terminal-like domain-containing protein [Sorangium sp. So ce185]|uniref:type I polyketide synthase n=1 Tax=Sorangium sp. So ce185 TaxID=3133287 RepID=UPI003F5FF637
MTDYEARLRQAIATIRELRAERDALARARSEPIAVIGMACRFPGGASTPEAYWRLLEDGVDAVTEIPAERWRLEPAADEAPDPRARATRWGAFLRDVDKFDARFFGISPREAAAMDPQQRLLLEVAWEALERGGQVPERLAGTSAGVFLGMSTNDYAHLCGAFEPGAQDIHAMTGNFFSFPAGRLSYTLGLHGPSLTVDTACSSSLVAVHLACQSLRSGECSLALAGGVNLLLSPATMRLIATTGALSPDGRCKVFDAEASGFVRGEGCGLVLLKRLSDAQADGDPICAVIRGSAVNQDGRSTGMTAPNVLSQQSMLKKALESAGVQPSEIGYVETHGTGTSLGDPIEIEALAQVVGRPRAGEAGCVLGAVKTNIGHLEAAAGVAGLIKAVLALQHGAIPANLHFRALNPRIRLEGTSLSIPTRKLAWKAGGAARLAGVSAFGLSGTNAHVILEEAPPSAAASAGEAKVVLLPLSARSPEALVAAARAMRDLLREPVTDASPRLADIAYTASARRSHHSHRLAVVGSSREELATSLDACAEGQAPPGATRGVAEPGARASVVFVFPGQGSQWAGMHRELFAEEPSYRAALEACDALVRRHAGWSLLDELDAPEATSRLQETEVAQPALLAVQVAMAELWRSLDVRPGAVIGHSVGEIAAAHVAGVLSLEEAVRLVVLRGRLMQRTKGLGKMALVGVPADEAARLLEGAGDRLTIAAVNDPRSAVLAGDEEALSDVLRRLRGEGVDCRLLPVSHAFHSAQMAPLDRELELALSGLAPRRAALPLFSTVTGAPAAGGELDPAYWARNMREPVRFAGAVDAALAAGYRIFLEVGPHPVLAGHLQQCFSARGAEARAASSLRRGLPARRCLLVSLGALHAHGHAVAWHRLYPAGGRCVPLPTYAWQRTRHWIARERPEAPAAPAAPRPSGDAPAPEPEPAGGSAPDALPDALIERLRAAAADERRRLLEAWLQTAVAQTLGLDGPEPIAPGVSLLDLGLDSLMSLELRDRLELGLKVKLPINLLLEHPTVAALAERALDALRLPARPDGERAERGERAPAGGGAPRRSPLVAIQPGGEGSPFFCVHPFGGPVLCYTELARHLGTERSFYGLQAVGLDDGAAPDDRIEDMAARYLEAIRTVRPAGPYLLGGWSLGGLVAFAMAHELARSGERVALLAMIDGYISSPSSPERRLWQLVESARMARPEMAYDELRRLDEGALTALVLGAARGVAPGFAEAVQRLGAAHGRAARSYVMPCYGGRVVYFRAAEQPPPGPFGPVTEPYGTLYQPMAGISSQPIEIHEVPGSHHTMLREPHVRVLAERLRERLLAADVRPR